MDLLAAETGFFSLFSLVFVAELLFGFLISIPNLSLSIDLLLILMAVVRRNISFMFGWYRTSNLGANRHHFQKHVACRFFIFRFLG
uniref:Uncharacterized protein n=1 Tax=Arundo donax TaxID=35708 RepID=A0A0A9F5B9_ARUDO